MTQFIECDYCRQRNHVDAFYCEYCGGALPVQETIKTPGGLGVPIHSVFEASCSTDASFALCSTASPIEFHQFGYRGDK